MFLKKDRKKKQQGTHESPNRRNVLGIYWRFIKADQMNGALSTAQRDFSTNSGNEIQWHYVVRYSKDLT